MDKQGLIRGLKRAGRAWLYGAIPLTLTVASAEYVQVIKDTVKGNEVLVGIVIIAVGGLFQALDKIWRDYKANNPS